MSNDILASRAAAEAQRNTASIRELDLRFEQRIRELDSQFNRQLHELHIWSKRIHELEMRLPPKLPDSRDFSARVFDAICWAITGAVWGGICVAVATSGH